MSYVTASYNITISNISDEFYTSRYPSSAARPMLIYPGDLFWGYMMFGCKCTKSPSGGFWFRIWTILNNGWQTAVSDPEWVSQNGGAYTGGNWMSTDAHPGVYSPLSMADGVAFDGFHEIEFGYDNQYWDDDIIIATDRDSEVFRNKLLTYSFAIGSPVVQAV